ncbi:hypothetical protein SO802_009008 [Lithocarpus litseifolius]|uniref:Uncharacterized protein n=1 Tax=Lithocarpus litseifolius TaxID=425828 RepID=A0AAW2DFT8_9ROSI
MSEVRSSELETGYRLATTLLRWRWILLLLAKEKLGLSMPSGRCVLWTLTPSPEMTTKFNQMKYTKMKARKNEPLSNLRKRVVRVVEKGTLVTPIVSVPEATRVASPATSVEDITPRPKRQRMADKGKEKADSWSSSVWDDAGLALMRA